MGRTITEECAAAECGRTVRIDSTSVGFISSAANIDREQAILCDEHLNELLDGTTLDLSIGGQHTRSEEFQEQREERSLFTDDDEAEDDDPDIVIYAPFEGNMGWRAKVDAPDDADADVKQLSQGATRWSYNQRKGTWTVALGSVDTATEHFEERGYGVEVEPEVRARRADLYPPDDRE